MDIRPLTVIYHDRSEKYGVVLAKTPDVPYEEYRVQVVERDGNNFSAGFIGLFNRNEICPTGFCENDFLQMAILCAAAGYPASNDNWTAS